ncbi:MAG: hypothetical protein EXQ87_11300 [Alphaproteobacteria bacterium]|nr:hypothetical protein [Alphaproteobacteria bacterium]
MTLAGNVPMGFRRIVFIAEPPNGYGIYRPKPEAIFRSGEPLMIYVEPIGIGWRQEGEQFQARLTVDFELRSPEGQILTGQKEFGRFDFNSRERNFEIMTHLTLNVTGAPAGDYVFGATYHDKITGKSANFDLKFKIE